MGQIQFGSVRGVPVDAAVLERAADIIRERSTKPDSIATRALCKTLRKVAAAIRAEAAADESFDFTAHFADPHLKDWGP